MRVEFHQNHRVGQWGMTLALSWYESCLTVTQGGFGETHEHWGGYLVYPPIKNIISNLPSIVTIITGVMTDIAPMCKICHQTYFEK